MVRRALLILARYRGARLRHRFERLLVRLGPTEPQRLFGLTLFIGAACGGTAVGFHTAIRFAESHLIDRALAAPGRSWIAWTISLPVLGGLVAGIVLQYLLPGARGSGIPQVKAAYVLRDRRVPLRDATGKFFLSALQIGSGASLGREGPTVQICAGLASALGRLARISPRNLRRLLPVGAAAGIAAAFNAPVAAVTFTIEELLGTLDQSVLSGVVLAAALAAIIERGILGEHPVLVVGHVYGLHHASSLLFYGWLGLLAGVVAIAFNGSLLRLRSEFRRWWRLPPWAHPAFGGLATGMLIAAAWGWLGTGGLNGGGYQTLNRALAADLPVRVLVALCVMKLAATVFSYSSGGAGGIFAPSLFIGGMLGGAVGFLDRTLLHHESDVPGAFALVGMGAMFAGIVRAPITSVLIIFEMTGSYGLILPLMLANMTAYLVARRYQPTGIYDALLEQDGVRLPRRRILGEIAVSEAMTAPVETVPESEPFDSVMARLRNSTHSAYPVVDREGRLVGLLSLDDLRAHLGDQTLSPLAVAADLCRPHPPTARPDETLDAALDRMTRTGVDHLPVVDVADPVRLVGMLTLHDVLGVAERADAAGGDGPAE